jgi:hypothetical protein
MQIFVRFADSYAMALQLGRHFLDVNGMGDEDWDKLQSALNTSHAIKTLAR